MMIDVHSHVYVPACDDLIGRRRSGEQPDVRTRLAALDAMGIDVQVVSPAPAQFHYATEPALGRELARAQNEHVAGLVSEAPGRLLGFGTVPLQDVAGAVDELAVMARRFGLCGVQIGTTAAGKELDDPALEPFFARAEELGLLLFIHPTGFGGFPLRDYELDHLLGNPFAATVAAARLVLGGVLDRHPRLQVLLAHGGGALPYLFGRLTHGFSVRQGMRKHLTRSPAEYLSAFYYDTVVFREEILEFLVRMVGSGQILFGSDYPCDMSDPGFGETIRGGRLFAGVKENILHANARRLFRLETLNAPA